MRIYCIIDRHELVQVTHIKDPSWFVVQRLADMDQLTVLMNAINNYCETADPSHLVYDVNVGRWYLSVVVNWSHTQS